MRKPHAKSWIKNLPMNGAEAEELGLHPECTQEVIYGWLRAKDATLQSVAERCLSDFSDFGCKQSLRGLMSSLSEWRPFYEAKKMFSTLDLRTTAFEEALKTECPEAAPEWVAQQGQRYFTAMASAGGDSETFMDLEYLRLAKETAQTKAELEKAKLELRKVAESRSQAALNLEKEKFKASIRTKVEAGLAEIAEQVKGNTAAEAALERLQLAIQK